MGSISGRGVGEFGRLYNGCLCALGYFFQQLEDVTVKKAVSIFTLVALAAGGVMWQTHDAGAQDKTIEPLVSSYELMEILYEPFMDQLKESVATEPEKRRGWQTIYKNALAIGEATQLNTIRNDEDFMATPEWNQMNFASRDLAVTVSEAAKKKDFAGVTAQYQALVKSCNECHTKFVPDDAPTIEP